MPDVNQFIDFLVMECEDTAATAYVDALLAAAKVKITAGNGSLGFVESASANGKHVNRTKQFTSDEVAFACRRALRLYTGADSSSPITFPDFGDTFV